MSALFDERLRTDLIDRRERLVGAVAVLWESEKLTLEMEKGAPKVVKVAEVIGHRAHKGTAIVKRDRFTRIVPPPLVVPSLEVS